MLFQEYKIAFYATYTLKYFGINIMLLIVKIVSDFRGSRNLGPICSGMPAT